MFPRRIISLVVATAVTFFVLQPPTPIYAQSSFLDLPKPGQMVQLSPAYAPVLLKGIKLDPANPLRFEFLLDQGDNMSSPNAVIGDPVFKQESQRLIKYFLTCLTLPEEDLWVNLSPYEKDRMIEKSFGSTTLGRDMLAQDYVLKQLTASLIYPEKELGKEFWGRVYAKAQEKYGDVNIPINTFNKVWVLADEARVFSNGDKAYILDAKMKVMLEEDYLAKEKTLSSPVDSLASQVIKEVIIPELEKEINTGTHFAPLRQMYHAFVLASWYKKNLKESIVNQVYANKKKVGSLSFPNLPAGRQVLIGNPQQEQPLTPEQIYQRYLVAYKKGVFNYIKDPDPTNVGSGATSLPRKYFSGGTQFKYAANEISPAQLTPADRASITADTNLAVVADLNPTALSASQAMINITTPEEKEYVKHLRQEVESVANYLDLLGKDYVARYPSARMDGLYHRIVREIIFIRGSLEKLEGGGLNGDELELLKLSSVRLSAIMQDFDRSSSRGLSKDQFKEWAKKVKAEYNPNGKGKWDLYEYFSAEFFLSDAFTDDFINEMWELANRVGRLSMGVVDLIEYLKEKGVAKEGLPVLRPYDLEGKEVIRMTVKDYVKWREIRGLFNELLNAYGEMQIAYSRTNNFGGIEYELSDRLINPINHALMKGRQLNYLTADEWRDLAENLGALRTGIAEWSDYKEVAKQRRMAQGFISKYEGFVDFTANDMELGVIRERIIGAIDFGKGWDEEDRVVLEEAGIPVDQLKAMSMEDWAKALNVLVRKADFYQKVGARNLSSQADGLLERARAGEVLAEGDLTKLNRSLLRSMYRGNIYAIMKFILSEAYDQKFADRMKTLLDILDQNTPRIIENIQALRDRVPVIEETSSNSSQAMVAAPARKELKRSPPAKSKPVEIDVVSAELPGLLDRILIDLNMLAIGIENDMNRAEKFDALKGRMEKTFFSPNRLDGKGFLLKIVAERNEGREWKITGEINVKPTTYKVEYAQQYIYLVNRENNSKVGDSVRIGKDRGSFKFEFRNIETSKQYGLVLDQAMTAPERQERMEIAVRSLGHGSGKFNPEGYNVKDAFEQIRTYFKMVGVKMVDEIVNSAIVKVKDFKDSYSRKDDVGVEDLINSMRDASDALELVIDRAKEDSLLKSLGEQDKRGVNIAIMVLDIFRQGLQSRINMADGVRSNQVMKIDDIVAQVQERVNGLERAKRFGLSASFQGNISLEVSDVKGIHISGEEFHLMNTLNNLIINAQEAGATDITIKFERIRGKVQIKAIDNGKGLDSQKHLSINSATGRQHIFDLDNTDKPEGTGLGTTEAWYAIKDMGGRIDAKNRTDGIKGAEFIINLPIINQKSGKGRHDFASIAHTHTPGGIAFKLKDLKLKDEGASLGVLSGQGLGLSAAIIAQLSAPDFNGFTPIIREIKPIADPFIYLGLSQ